MKTHLILLAFITLSLVPALCAQVPQLINYQGRVVANGTNFDGTGQFKFALVDATGGTTYWSNDGSSTAGSEPTTTIAITVSKGLYSVLLGDATQPHMTIVPATVFTHADVHLRIWFSDGTNGSQLLSPDKRIAAVGYALMADSVSDGAITTAKVAAGAITTPALADGAVTSAKLAPGVVQTSNLAAAAVGNAQLANPALTVTAGSGLSGGGLVALGGSITLGNSGVLSITAGGGITTDASTGSLTLGSTATSANTPAAIVARDASGNFAAGTITAALLKLQPGVPLVTPVLGAVEFDGTNLFVTNNNASPTRKTVAFTDTPLVNAQIADGAITSAKLEAGAAAANLSATGLSGVPSGALVLSATESAVLVGAGYVRIGGTLAPIEWQQRVNGTPPSVRHRHTAIWTGGEMIIWGGTNAIIYFNDGGRFNPTANSWTTISTTGAPTARNRHTAVWTGSEMIICGGENSNYTNTGGRYNPATNTWTELSTAGAPTARSGHTAVWTGSEMIIWGGEVR